VPELVRPAVRVSAFSFKFRLALVFDGCRRGGRGIGGTVFHAAPLKPIASVEGEHLRPGVRTTRQLVGRLLSGTRGVGVVSRGFFFVFWFISDIAVWAYALLLPMGGVRFTP